MKKSVNEMLNAMKVNPIEAEKVYYQKCKRWTPADFGAFWYEAMKNYPEDGVKETANRLIDYLYENDLLDYEYIAEDYVELYKSSPYIPVRSFINHITTGVGSTMRIIWVKDDLHRKPIKKNRLRTQRRSRVIRST